MAEAAPIAPAGPTAPPSPANINPPAMGKEVPRAPSTEQDLAADPFEKFDKAADQTPPPDKPLPAKETKPEPEKEVKKDIKPADKETKPADDKNKPADGKPDEKPKTGWQRYREAEKKIAALNQEKAELEAKLKTAPAAPPADFKVDDHPEFKKTRETLAQREKRLAELEDQIRFVDYEKSSEYQEKYHQPYVRTAQAAVAEVSKLKITNEDGTSRQATGDDLWRLVGISDPEQALEAAEKLFGNPARAAYAVSLRNKILDAHSIAEQAKQEFRTKGSEQMKLKAAEKEKISTERAAKFQEVSTSAIEKYPHWFKPEEGDDKGNELLETGFMLANAAFGGQIKDGKTGEMRDPTEDEMVLINAQLRNKAAGFDRLAYKYGRDIKAKDERIAELEQELKDYRESDPPTGEPEGGKKKDVEDDPFAKFEK